MGEKGNALGALGASGAGAAMIATAASESLVERVSESATSTAVGLGQDFLETVKDKSIGAVADNTVAAARERLQRKDNGEADSPGEGPAAAGDGRGEDAAAAGSGSDPV